MARTKKTKYSSDNLPLELKVSHEILAVQSITTACLGAIGIFVAALSIAEGTRWLLFGALVFGISVVILGVAFGLWRLKSLLTRFSGRWTRVTFVTEAILFSFGVSLYELIRRFPQSGQGTDGPFADGEAGALGLVAYAYAAGVLVVVFLTWHYARQTLIRQHT